ncbi:MAG TPA: Hpt domain-containing protein, partial [bacterium]|nr:Hpt domain-containing protein [bacterium]
MAKSFKTAKTIKLFLDECKEYLTTLNQDLVDLESGNTDEELIKRVSRNVHTLKGSSAMLEFMDISEISHAIEDVMENLKKEFPNVNKTLLDEIFTKVDHIESLVQSIENGTYEEGATPPPPKPAAPPPEAVAPPLPPPPPPPEVKAAPVEKPVEAPPAQPQPGKPRASVPAGRTNLLDIAGVDILPALDRCLSVFNEVEAKFILADDNIQNKLFFGQLFESVEYLHRSLSCYGEPAINEMLSKLLIVKTLVDDGKIKIGNDVLEVIFKGVSHVKAIIENATSPKPQPRQDITPFLKKVEKITESIKSEKDFVPVDTGVEIFDRLNVDKKVAEYFVPYEKQAIAKALVDGRNIFHIKAKFKTSELGDLASMSEFFKPLTESGVYIAVIIVGQGTGKEVNEYVFNMFFSTEMTLENFDKKYSFLKKTGSIETSEVAILSEQHDHAPAVESETASAGGTEAANGVDVAVKPAKAAPQKIAAAPAPTVRVDTSKLDVLVNLIAELVINHNKMEQEVKTMKQLLNQFSDMFENVKLGKKTSSLRDRDISLEELLQPLRALQPDAILPGDQQLDAAFLANMKEFRIIRESLVQLFDMELEKDRLLEETVSRMSMFKSVLDMLCQEFVKDGLNIGQVIEELQDETMKLRMLP